MGPALQHYQPHYQPQHLKYPNMKTLFATTALACSVMAQNPPPSGGDPPFVPPAVNRAALNDLYKSTGGANWKNNDVSVLILLIYGQNCSHFY